MGARQRRSREDGFTLMELAVVMIIIAILATIAIAVFLGQREKAQRSSAISSLRNATTYAIAITQDEDVSGFSDDPARYEREGGGGIRFTDGPSPGPRTVSIATFDGGDTLVLAARGSETCFWVRLADRGSQDERGKVAADEPTDCDADQLEEADPEGW